MDKLICAYVVKCPQAKANIMTSVSDMTEDLTFCSLELTNFEYVTLDAKKQKHFYQNH